MDNLRKEILEEANFTAYSVHPGATKMYHSIRDLYWWDEIGERELTGPEII